MPTPFLIYTSLRQRFLTHSPQGGITPQTKIKHVLYAFSKLLKNNLGVLKQIV